MWYNRPIKAKEGASLKFLHISDLHFGKTIHGINLIDSDDQPVWVDRFLALAERVMPQAVVIAGDVYDRSAPSEEAVKLLSRMVTALKRMDIAVLISAGNHDSGKRLSAFSLKIIPYFTNGAAAYMTDTFEEEIEREYSVDKISIADGDSYSDFTTNDRFDEGIWPHHFTVSRDIYFSGAQIAVCQYRSGGRTVYVDDDQMVFINVGCGAGDDLINTLPIDITEEEKLNSQWEMGIVSRYVLPVYQKRYNLPQGAWLKKVELGSPADDAGLQKGDVIVGVGDITILGDATLRKARASIEPGKSAELTFWREGIYYTTEILRPEE